MDALLDVIKVEARPGYLLYLEFENGEQRIFDMTPYMDKQPFVRLKAYPLFAMANIDTARSSGLAISTYHLKRFTTGHD